MRVFNKMGLKMPKKWLWLRSDAENAQDGTEKINEVTEDERKYSCTQSLLYKKANKYLHI